MKESRARFDGIHEKIADGYDRWEDAIRPALAARRSLRS